MADEQTISRRRFVGGVIATGATAAVPDTALAARKHHKRKRSSSSNPTRRVDVVVVGAGLAGLTAARDVVKAGKSAVGLEARGRVGGRTLNHDLGGGPDLAAVRAV